MDFALTVPLTIELMILEKYVDQILVMTLDKSFWRMEPVPPALNILILMLILGFALQTPAQPFKFLEQMVSALTVPLTIELMILEKYVDQILAMTLDKSYWLMEPVPPALTILILMLILGFALQTPAQPFKFLEQMGSALTVHRSIELTKLEKSAGQTLAMMLFKSFWRMEPAPPVLVTPIQIQTTERA
jgi:hypothetical protein